MTSSYSSDVEGGAPVCHRFSVAGRMDLADYLSFVVERAQWFGLSGWVEADAGEVTVVAAGPEAMVGALEMAVTLGPMSALIGSVSSAQQLGPVAAGFRVRQK